jgi:hypothetical protein
MQTALTRAVQPAAPQEQQQNEEEDRAVERCRKHNTTEAAPQTSLARPLGSTQAIQCFCIMTGTAATKMRPLHLRALAEAASELRTLWAARLLQVLPSRRPQLEQLLEKRCSSRGGCQKA